MKCIFFSSGCGVVHCSTTEESPYNKDVRMIAQLRQLAEEPDQLAKLKRAVLNVCPESGEKLEVNPESFYFLVIRQGPQSYIMY